MNGPLCMFCGKAIVAKEDSTQEHFVPKCLWEKGHRPIGTKTLPAHKTCNSEFSEDNEYFRDVLVMEAGAEKHPAARQVQQGTIQRKLDHHFGSLRANLKNLRIRPIRTRSGLEIGNHPSFEVDSHRINRVLRNVMKGIFYVSQDTPMPQEFIYSISDAADVNQEWLRNVTASMVPWQSFGDTTFCCRYVVSHRRPVEKMTCLMQFYERRLFVGEAVAPELLDFVPAGEESKVLIPLWCSER